MSDEQPIQPPPPDVPAAPPEPELTPAEKLLDAWVYAHERAVSAAGADRAPMFTTGDRGNALMAELEAGAGTLDAAALKAIVDKHIPTPAPTGAAGQT